VRKKSTQTGGGMEKTEQQQKEYQKKQGLNIERKFPKNEHLIRLPSYSA
jgi:hypothetical protein